MVRECSTCQNRKKGNEKMSDLVLLYLIQELTFMVLMMVWRILTLILKNSKRKK